jgi:hypothetical protein
MVLVFTAPAWDWYTFVSLPSQLKESWTWLPMVVPAVST